MLNSTNKSDKNASEKVSIFWPNQETRGVHINISGGGIVINDAHPLLENLIIENNTAGYSGGGLFIQNGDSTVINNIYVLNKFYFV